MPASGDQHINPSGKSIMNPFEEAKPRVSQYTAQEIATLQSRLEKQLGPEYISSRSGPSGQKVHYITAEKCIQLANEVFGFNGWSSQIMDVQLDFLDEHPQTLKISIGISVIIRVTLRDGTFHEDIGYGNIDNCKGKAPAFEKAKKEATTDALKRALKNFGNVLGNCIYDKDYLAKVTKVKVEKPRWDVENLYRHSDYVLPKPQVEPQKGEEMEKRAADGASIESENTLEDEFGDFDEEDFSIPDPDSHPDEVVLPAPRITSNLAKRASNGNTSSKVPTNQNGTSVNHQSATWPPNGVQNSGGVVAAQQPQTPNSGFARAAGTAGQVMRPPQVQQGKTVIGGRVLNQPSRTGLPAPESPARLNKPLTSNDNDNTDLPPPGRGFLSARAAAMVPETTSVDALLPSHNPNLPAFNPHLESPSIRKTPGVDHKSSKPITKDLKPVTGEPQTAGITGKTGIGRGGVVNPQLDTARQIGAPGRVSSPLQNRGSYKPPTIKRSIDGGGGNANRPPLENLPTNGPVGASNEGGGDTKRQKLNP